MADLTNLQTLVPAAFDAVTALGEDLAENGTANQKSLFNAMHHALRDALTEAETQFEVTDQDLGLPAQRGGPSDKPEI